MSTSENLDDLFKANINTLKKMDRFFCDRLTVNKIIYPKRKGLSAKELNSILQLEIDTHLLKNPDLEFKGVGKEIKNSDYTITYPLNFIHKKPVPQSNANS